LTNFTSHCDLLCPTLMSQIEPEVRPGKRCCSRWSILLKSSGLKAAMSAAWHANETSASTLPLVCPTHRREQNRTRRLLPELNRHSRCLQIQRILRKTLPPSRKGSSAGPEVSAAEPPGLGSTEFAIQRRFEGRSSQRRRWSAAGRATASRLSVLDRL
jgi:hypothetical protein